MSGTVSESDGLAADGPVVAIVMPAYNAAHLLPVTVDAARTAARGADVVVVDPGSTDGTPEVAEARGARVVRLGKRAGPAEARNVGVDHVDADVVVFVDSDCVASPDVVDRIQRAFWEDPGLVSLTGSYDDSPPDPGFFSQYMNLRHHHTHQRALRENATFWAGLGAVRVAAFRACDGFDAVRYPKPMIEDIELGLRLRAHGRTGLDPDLHVTHLKRWTLGSVVKTDIFCRALPWSQLILEQGALPNDLNLRATQRIAAVVAPIALLSVLALPILAWLDPRWLPLPLAVLLLSLVLNFGLVRFFLARRGVLFAIGGWLFHQVHLFYSAATLGFVILTRPFRRRRP